MKKLALAILMAGSFCGMTPASVVSTSVPMPAHAVFTDGFHADITPSGWLEEILNRQNAGLTSHPEAMSYPFDSDLWVGELKRDSEKRGADWWRYEQTAYYLDGLTRLGYILNDAALLQVARDNIEWVLAHPLPAKKGTPYTKADVDSLMKRGNRFNAEVTADPKALARMKRRRSDMEKQLQIKAIDRPEGRLGADAESMAWPWAVYFRAVKAYYEATGDPRIPAALEKHYLSFPVIELGRNRFVVNVEGLLWTYSITGNPRLLEMAEEAWAQNGSELTQASCLDNEPFQMHGVTMNELMKIPVILYEYTGKKEYLDAALNADYKMERYNMLVDGVNSSSEALAGNDALASHETCDISDYTWTIGYYLMATGDAQWADRIERAIFNAGLGAVTKDFKTMQYFSCPNQVIATGNSNHNDFKYGTTWMAYRPIHETECCIGNLHRYMPNYAARMWMKDRNGYPVAALYAPGSVEFTLPDGTVAKIEQRTNYPFEENVEFTFNFYKDGVLTDAPMQMDFTYRIPGWANDGKAEFKTISKSWQSGETFSLNLPMHIKVVDNGAKNGVSVERGPILYSFPIEANVVEDPAIYENLAGKASGNPEFKSWSMTPVGKWNYAIDTNSLKEIRVNRHDTDGFPFDEGLSPVTIDIPVVGVKDWNLVKNQFTPALPEKVMAETDGNGQVVRGTIRLVPYGTTTLRLTNFPSF